MPRSASKVARAWTVVSGLTEITSVVITSIARIVYLPLFSLARDSRGFSVRWRDFPSHRGVAATKFDCEPILLRPDRRVCAGSTALASIADIAPYECCYIIAPYPRESDGVASVICPPRCLCGSAERSP